MPQLDTLTFFSQAVTMFVLVSFFFILIVAVVLPSLFRIQKTRMHFLSNVLSIDAAFSSQYSLILQTQNFLLTKTFSDSIQNLESLSSELQLLELLPESEEELDELITELCLEGFDFFVAADVDEEFGKSSLFDFEEDFEETFDDV